VPSRINRELRRRKNVPSAKREGQKEHHPEKGFSSREKFEMVCFIPLNVPSHSISKLTRVLFKG